MLTNPSGPWINANEGVLHSPQISWTEASLPDTVSPAWKIIQNSDFHQNLLTARWTTSQQNELQLNGEFDPH